MILSVDIISRLTSPLPLGAFLPSLPLDSLFSTQGIMVMLLGAYAFAMWMFLTSAPKVHTIMVSDLAIARQFYEGLLELSAAEVPLHYYYNYEQTMGSTSIDPLYMSTNLGTTQATQFSGADGLWYQLKKNTQLHVISGASLGNKNQQRHVCFDHQCLDQVLMLVQMRRLKYKVRTLKPLNFLVKDLDDRVIELAEVSN
ncbi:MAG: glyoxalase-like domain protein [Moorea sp. SIO1F2]|uniref:glyoxalase-like domain protein n=1 Tax=unclassified Moorena TaxID=2683338 RepID=UPI0013B8DAD1|nr:MULTISPECIES: glyoxalase-like domain protein [unclassified Moorena]NEN95415.1 glyoxalase-like domain protein [Moorena sp. SIO3I7]NEO05057.1 glyoxalase-like domain protein [Moorena sp. SIO3I8]NEO18750.1 glyoxalase-like domain protein [Moorena sp. SIO4A5]NEP24217.1 glyoxalase-like domain protein [Moorena sp. SIO3I6]NEQ61738.1 glyoxalase-like domain protein [Moorena sp. SIO4A1]